MSDELATTAPATPAAADPATPASDAAPSSVAERRAARAAGTGKAARDARYRAKKANEKKAAGGGATPATSATPAAAPARPEADRRRDLVVFVRFAWRLANVLAYFVGRRLEALTDDELEDQAATLLPLTARHPAFDRACYLLAAPFNLVDLLARKMHRRPPAARGDGGRVVPIRSEVQP